MRRLKKNHPGGSRNATSADGAESSKSDRKKNKRLGIRPGRGETHTVRGIRRGKLDDGDTVLGTRRSRGGRRRWRVPRTNESRRIGSWESREKAGKRQGKGRKKAGKKPDYTKRISEKVTGFIIVRTTPGRNEGRRCSNNNRHATPGRRRTGKTHGRQCSFRSDTEITTAYV